MDTKMGRPKLNNPKDITLKFRSDKELLDKLNYLSEKHQISKSDVIRKGIEIQYRDEIKKK